MTVLGDAPNDACLICREHRGEVDVPGGLLDDGLVITFHRPPLDEPLVYAGHLLVTSKRHAADFAALNPDEAAAVGSAISTYSAALKTLGATRVYVATIGHHVDHLHVHLLPRWPGTPAEIPWHSIDTWEGARRIPAHAVEHMISELRQEARVHNPRMNQPAQPVVPPDKQSLRRQLRAQRRSLAPQRDRGADADAIAAAASAFLDTLTLPPSDTGEHSAYSGQPCVAIYRSLPIEPPTHALAEMLHARGVPVIVPETLPDMDLDWHELRADGSEGPALGLEAIGAALLILTPGLAVDHSGTRLGQGGGCYDRALARRHPDAVLVAIVNDEEYAARPLPRDAHDVRVNAVITPGVGLWPIPAAGSVA